jgi:recombination protein RecT
MNSTTDELRKATGAPPPAQTIAPKAQTFPQLLDAFKSQIQLALPKHMNADRMARIALTCFRMNPQLAECDPKSVFAAVILGAQMGLEPGVLGQAYLIPYKDRKKGITTCQFVPGWQGLADLVNRAGRASVWTGAVYEGDKFEFAFGSSPFLVHIPTGEEVKLTHCYAIGRVKAAEYPVIEVWSVPKLLRHRDHFNRVGDRHYSYEHFEMYGRKIALLQVLKYMPKSVELTNAMGLDNAAEAGAQNVDLKEAIDGSFVTVDVPEQEQTS